MCHNVWWMCASTFKYNPEYFQFPFSTRSQIGKQHELIQFIKEDDGTNIAFSAIIILNFTTCIHTNLYSRFHLLHITLYVKAMENFSLRGITFYSGLPNPYITPCLSFFTKLYVCFLLASFPLLVFVQVWHRVTEIQFLPCQHPPASLSPPSICPHLSLRLCLVATPLSHVAPCVLLPDYFAAKTLCRTLPASAPQVSHCATLLVHLNSGQYPSLSAGSVTNTVCSVNCSHPSLPPTCPGYASSSTFSPMRPFFHFSQYTRVGLMSSNLLE